MYPGLSRSRLHSRVAVGRSNNLTRIATHDAFEGRRGRSYRVPSRPFRLVSSGRYHQSQACLRASLLATGSLGFVPAYVRASPFIPPDSEAKIRAGHSSLRAARDLEGKPADVRRPWEKS